MVSESFKANGREKRAIQNLAAALQECFNAAAALAEERLDARDTELKTHIDARLDARDAELKTHIDARADRQDNTLRMIWRQTGGSRSTRLPIDD